MFEYMQMQHDFRLFVMTVLFVGPAMIFAAFRFMDRTGVGEPEAAPVESQGVPGTK